MTRQEHLLFILAEECSEVAQRASKQARFGRDESQPGQDLTNAQRLADEICDVLAMVEMLCDEDMIPEPFDRLAIEAKKAKVEKYLRYSEECGTLEGPPCPSK